MTVEAQYRRFLLATAAAIYLASAVELLLVEHYEGFWQAVPFGVIAVGLGAIAWAGARPQARSVRALWGAGALAVTASLIGVVQHLRGNAAFALEVEPDLGVAGAVWGGLDGGNPLLAPGMVALAGLLAAAAGWRHPRLGSPTRPGGEADRAGRVR